MKATTASGLWEECDGMRRSLLTRTERYAALTIPKIMLRDGFNHESEDQSHDYQSIGAQAVNHVTNKLMLALFSPSRPFIKLEAGKNLKGKTAETGVTQTQLDEVLAQGERDAIKELDSLAQRPKLYQVCRHLVVSGNVLMCLLKDDIRVLGLRYFVIKRDVEGKQQDLVIKERVLFDELSEEIQAVCGRHYKGGEEVDHYKWITRDPGGKTYSMTQWINQVRLPKQFNGRWPIDRSPYHVLTWDLADEANYGTGLVEDYVGDFEALSALSEAVVDGSVLGSEYRWGVSPTGLTSVEDLKQSRNGDALPAVKDDIHVIQGGNSQALEVANTVSGEYERRVSRGFLMSSAVIRDAERVTQEEVRLTAQELETSFGGVYSSLAVTLQKPIAEWLFNKIGMPLAGTDIKVTILTGLDALSRNGDLDAFRLAMADLAAIAQLPPDYQMRIKADEVMLFIGQGRGVDMKRFLRSEAEVKKLQEEAMAQRALETIGTEAGVAQATQPQGPQ